MYVACLVPNYIWYLHSSISLLIVVIMARCLVLLFERFLKSHRNLAQRYTHPGFSISQQSIAATVRYF